MEKPEIVENGDSNLKTSSTSNSSNSSNEENIDENKLRGDAIGNTVYSERYVLETLLKLKDSKWNKELEDDLCCLWDMTLDKDVVIFLLDNNFIDLAVNIIKGSTELRLTEILVGIIGNMCIHQVAAEKAIKSTDFDVLLSLIFSDDPLTLIQIMRLIKSLLYIENIDCRVLITDDILNQINFVLCSAKNAELLDYTLQVCGQITNKDKTIFTKINLLESIAEAFNEIIDFHSKNYLDTELEKHLSTYLKVIENVCSLINDETDATKIKEYLEQYAGQNFLLRESKTVEYFIYCTAIFLISFQTETNSTIFNYFIDVYQNIIDDNLKETFETDVCEYISNYLIYFVENTNLDDLKKVVAGHKKDELKKLFLDEIVANNDCTIKFKDIVNELFL